MSDGSKSNVDHVSICDHWSGSSLRVGPKPGSSEPKEYPNQLKPTHSELNEGADVTLQVPKSLRTSPQRAKWRPRLTLGRSQIAQKQSIVSNMKAQTLYSHWIDLQLLLTETLCFPVKSKRHPRWIRKNIKISIKIDVEPQNLFLKFGGIAWSRIMRFSKDQEQTLRTALKAHLKFVLCL